MFQRRKDGSLNLSIQAIVILVMAMAVLGLGLGFIRGLITKGEENLGSAIDNAQLENPADATRPITFDKKVRVKAGETSDLNVGYYSSAGNDNVSIKKSSCVPSTGTTQGTTITISSPSQGVAAGQAVGFRALVTTQSTTETGTYVCSATADGNTDSEDKSFQFIVEVTG